MQAGLLDWFAGCNPAQANNCKLATTSNPALNPHSTKRGHNSQHHTTTRMNPAGEAVPPPKAAPMASAPPATELRVQQVAEVVALMQQRQAEQQQSGLARFGIEEGPPGGADPARSKQSPAMSATSSSSSSNCRLWATIFAVILLVAAVKGG